MSEKNRDKTIWRVIVEDSGRIRVVDSKFTGYQTRHVVAQVCDNGGRRHKNAMLIAAAPEMYKLLKESVERIEHEFSGDDVTEVWLEEAKDVLRRASEEKR